DLRQLQCDYVCFSGHKMCGPTGIGVLCALGDAIDQLVPLCVGGGSVESVQDDDVHWRAAPHRFEAGTPHIAGAIGLAAACDYLDSVGIQAIESHVAALSTAARRRLGELPKVRVWGPDDPRHCGGAVAWTLEGVDPHTVARVLSDRFNICVRSGLHCAEPAHRAAHAPETVRASFYLYNTRDEIDVLVDALGTIGAQLSS
ncbi:MAG: aminotransferase class V-fold PLP-dependent enzyme, partial [Planctomycetales bacterium]|nr:aminotransferase class V-fold PLP-dependent enzyme [Planctomycetales bacterium]